MYFFVYLIYLNFNFKIANIKFILKIKFLFITDNINNIYLMGIGGLGIGDWGLGIGPNPQSPIPIIKLTFLKIFI